MALTGSETKRLVWRVVICIVAMIAITCLFVAVDHIKPRVDPNTEITSSIRVMPTNEFLMTSKTNFEFGTMYMIEDTITEKFYVVVSNGGSLAITPRTETEAKK